MTAAAFAVPGSLTTQTGGYFYDRRLVEELRALGHDIRVVTLPSGFPAPGAEAMQRAVAALAALPADLPVIVDGLAWGALPGDAVRQLRAPVIALVHHPLALETGLPRAEAAALWRSESHNLRHARHILVPSPHTRDLLLARYQVPPDKITILRPGADRPAPGPTLRDTPPLILSVGLLHPRKGHAVLIAALDRLADLDWRAVIAGTPWDAAHVAALTAQAATAAGGGRVRIASAIPDAQRDALYRRASLFALATRFEGYGIVFNEALLHGLPIVTCRTGAVPDTVPADAGILVPVDDVAALAHALRAVLTDPARRQNLAQASALAGAALPGWTSVAQGAARVLAQVAR